MDTMFRSGHDDLPETDSLLGPFLREADTYLRTQIDRETYQRIMGYEAGRAHPYVAARILLDEFRGGKLGRVTLEKPEEEKDEKA